MTLASRWNKHIARLRTEPDLKRNTIAVATLVVLALVAGGGILANQRFSPPWADHYELVAEFEAVPGISPGNGQEVRMAGIIVGQITEVEVGPEGRARVVMELEPEQKVYRNARLVLRPKSPLNEMYVTIDPGGPPAEVVPSGGVLPVTNTQRPVQVDEVLGHLDDNARAALTSLLRESDAALASAPRSLAPGLDAADGVLADLRPVVETLDSRRAKLRRLVTALGQISSAVGEHDERLVNLAGSLDVTLAAVADNQDALAPALRDLPALTRTLKSSTRAVHRLSEQLEPTLKDVHRATDTLPRALAKVSATSRDLRTTVELARPVAEKARPVVNDLRPFVFQLTQALPVVERTTQRLDPVTAAFVKYLPDLGAFLVQTRSFTSIHDANGGIIRGMIEVTPTSFPVRTHGALSPVSTYPKP